jgi:hypothetical protein
LSVFIQIPWTKDNLWRKVMLPTVPYLTRRPTREKLDNEIPFFSAVFFNQVTDKKVFVTCEAAFLTFSSRRRGRGRRGIHRRSTVGIGG